MNLAISSTNLSFGSSSILKKFAKSMANGINSGKRCARIPALKKINPNKCSKKILLDIDIEKILGVYKNFTIKDFNSLSKLEYDAIKLHSSIKYKKEFKALSDMVSATEKWLDKKYGKGNWVFVSIGRSLEPLADALSYKGYDTKILPISGLHRHAVSPQEIVSQKDFKIYEEYLKKIGISKEDIANDTRHYIFSDYCNTGRTIQTVKKMLRYYCDINSDNVDFASFVALYEDAYKKGPKCKLTAPDKIETMLQICSFKKFCKTDKVPCDDIKRIKKILNMPQSIDSKIFHFKLMDKYLPKKLDYTA